MIRSRVLQHLLCLIPLMQILSLTAGCDDWQIQLNKGTNLYGTRPTADSNKLTADNGYPEVVIRFPAFVYKEALPEWERRFAARANLEHPATGRITEHKNGEWFSAYWDVFYFPPHYSDASMFNEASKEIVDSTYFAVEMREVLRKYIPADRIYLEPQGVQIGADGKLFAISPAGKQNARLYVDLWTWRTPPPDPSTPGDQWLGTIGGQLMPMLTISVSDTAGTGKLRAIAGSPIKRIYTGDSGETYINDLYYEPLEDRERAIPKWDEPLNDLPVTKTRPIKPGSFFATGLHQYSVQDSALQEYANANDSPSDISPFKPIWDLYACLIVDSLNNDSRTFDAIDPGYISIFDKELPRGGANRAAAVDQDLPKLALIRQFAEAERTFIRKQDENFAQRIYRGNFGSAFRQTLIAESTVVSEFNSSSQRSQAAMMSMTMANLHSNLAVADHTMSGVQALQSELPAFMGAVAAKAAEEQFASDIEKTVRRTLDRTSDAEEEYVFNTSVGKSTITAHGVADLRSKCATLYHQIYQ